jgi:hypothetical protein
VPFAKPFTVIDVAVDAAWENVVQVEPESDEYWMA